MPSHTIPASAAAGEPACTQPPRRRASARHSGQGAWRNGQPREDRAAQVPRPALGWLAAEPWRASLDYLAHQLQSRPDRLGDGHPVLLYPGLGAHDRQMRPLREHLRAAGYAADAWGRGRNTGPGAQVDSFLRMLADDVAERARHAGRPLSLIGWSLGGLYAREVAKLVPQAVRLVVSLGTPFAADQDRSHAGGLFTLLNGSRPRMDKAMVRRLAEPPPVPTLAVFSRSDGVVPWQHCVHQAAAHDQHTIEGPTPRASGPVEDIEVECSHIGMPWNPQVLSVLRAALARPQPNRNPA